MTKFGKHPDKDIVDLAAEAAHGRARRRRRHDEGHGRPRRRQPDGRRGGIGQQLQKQIGQTGIPVYNVANACATGATALRTAIMAVKAGECDMGLAVGVEKLAGAGLLGGGGTPQDDGTTRGAPTAATARSLRSTAASAPRPCRACSRRSAWSTATSTAAPSFELFAKISEKNHAHSTLNPLAAYQKRFTLDEIMNDVMIAYPNTRPDVLGQLRRRRRRGGRVSDAKLKTLDPRAAAPGGQGRRRRCSPPTRGRRPARSSPTSTRSPATPPSRRTSRPASAPRTSTSSSCTTASPPPSSSTTTT